MWVELLRQAGRRVPAREHEAKVEQNAPSTRLALVWTAQNKTGVCAERARVNAFSFGRRDGVQLTTNWAQVASRKYGELFCRGAEFWKRVPFLENNLRPKR